MEILITLCARGGSKGIPGKNIRMLNGTPLIAITIGHALKFAEIYSAKISLSTDDLVIKQVAEKYGLKTQYIRPLKLSGDEVGKLETIKDLLDYEEGISSEKYEYILDLDITSPLRNINDLISAFELLRNNVDSVNLFSVSYASRNPYFNMVEKKDNGFYGLVKNGNFLTRQSTPIVYELNASFYFYKRFFFEQEDLKTISERSMIYLMPHICFDLDHPYDFDFMEFLLQNDKLGFDI
jgi:CMP-N,N'-diacetyllegionaminic acid synthase